MRALKELIESCAFKIIKGSKCPILINIKDEYKKKYGIIHAERHSYPGAMHERAGMKIADAYTQLVHAPDDLVVNAAYEQLATEVMQQFEFLNNKEKDCL